MTTSDKRAKTTSIVNNRFVIQAFSRVNIHCRQASS